MSTPDLTPGRPLLDALRAAGFAVTADGDKLVVSPRGRLTPAECEAVKATKGPLLAALAEEREACPRCRAWVDPDRGADVRTCCPRSDCPQGG